MRIFTCLVSLSFLVIACSPAPEAPKAEAPAAADKPPAEVPTGDKPEADKPAAEATDKVQNDAFLLSLKPAGPYKKGELGNFVVSIEPRGHWHINQEYPLAISIKGPDGLQLPKATLAKADAVKFGDELAKFDVPFTASASGEHRVECEVDFAMCTEETCVPDTRTLALALPVN